VEAVVSARAPRTGPERFTEENIRREDRNYSPSGGIGNMASRRTHGAAGRFERSARLGPNDGTQTEDRSILISVEPTSILFRKPCSCFRQIGIGGSAEAHRPPNLRFGSSPRPVLQIVADAKLILPSGGLEGAP
jgi:hypothetical protein